jgi:hypothetical protein
MLALISTARNGLMGQHANWQLKKPKPKPATKRPHRTPHPADAPQKQRRAADA